MEDWDKTDKDKYEKKKKYEKLTVDTLAKKEKMEKKQLAFRRARGMDDCLYNVGSLGSKAPIPLTLKFKISYAKKFDGIGNPKQPIRRYISITEMKGLDDKQTLYAFPLSLMGGALRWYYNLDPSKLRYITSW